jgi:excisionase family DNA binding protein
MRENLTPLAVPVQDAARLIGCGRSKIYELIKAKELPLIKLGRRSLISVETLKTFIAAKTKEAA